MGLLDDTREAAADVWDYLFGGATAAEADQAKFGAREADKSSASCPLAQKTKEYWVQVAVVTRLGEIPVAGVAMQVDGEDFGRSDQQGAFLNGSTPRQRKISASAFKIIAKYENTAEHLKLERVELELKDVDAAAKTCAGQVRNWIKKVQDVAGQGDLDFDEKSTVEESGTLISWQDTKDFPTLRVVVKVATFSLAVPYVNQNASTDSVTTIAGKDPEPAPHTHTVVTAAGLKYSGSVLCYPSSMTMIVRYWGATKTRTEVMQEAYRQWAVGGFDTRLDQKATLADAAPEESENGDYWLDTSKLDPKSGYALKRYKASLVWEAAQPDELEKPVEAKTAPAKPKKGLLWKDTSHTPPTLKRATYPGEWHAIADSDWRTVYGGAKVWQFPAFASKVFASFGPAGGSPHLSPAPSDAVLPLTRVTDADNARHAADFPAGKDKAGKPKPKNQLNDSVLSSYVDMLKSGWPFIASTTATDGHMMVVRGAVIAKDLVPEWLILNDPYGNLSSAGSVYQELTISDSVGFGGANVTADVEAVKEVFTALGLFDGALDGHCDGDNAKDPLVLAIKKAQKQKLGAASSDGLLETDSELLRKINSEQRAGYKEKGEKNAATDAGETGKRGLHVYYCNQTHGVGNILRFKGGGRGFPRIEKALITTEIAARLTAGA